MQQLVADAIEEVERWQESPEAANIPPRRISNIRDKLQALRGCGSVGLLRTGMEHVSGAIRLLGAPASMLAPSLLQLTSLLEERQNSPLRTAQDEGPAS